LQPALEEGIVADASCAIDLRAAAAQGAGCYASVLLGPAALIICDHYARFIAENTSNDGKLRQSTGIESPSFSGLEAGFERARPVDACPSDAPTPVDAGSALPDATAAFIEAAGRLAAQAVARGELATARRLLDAALRALDVGAGAKLRVVWGEDDVSG